MSHFKKAATIYLSLFALLFLVVTVAYAAPTYQIGTDKTGYINVYKKSYFNTIQSGSKLADKGFFAESVPYFEEAVESNPSSVMAQYNLGFSLMQAAGETTDLTLKNKKLEQAEWAFMRARDLNPELSLTYYKLGKIALGREDYKAACAYYKAGTENIPDNSVLQFNLAACYEKLKDFKHAEAAYLKVTRMNPKFVYAHNNLGLIYEQTNRAEQAEKIYKEALSQVPEYNFARMNLGSMYELQGRVDEAIELFREAIIFEPQNAWAYLYLGNAQYRKGNYMEALDAYDHAIALNPQYPATYYLMSLTLQKLNRPDEALAKGLQYINLAPDGAFSQEAGELVMTLQHTKSTSNTEKP